MGKSYRREAGKMKANLTGELLEEMERVRKELYVSVNGDVKSLTSQEIYKVSTNLDKLIVKYLKEKHYNNMK